MKLYDEVINQFDSLLPSESLSLPLNKEWKEEDKNQIIFKSECAYELGGSRLPALSGVFLTSNSNYVCKDEITLIGDDLASLKEDSPYARIALIQVDDSLLGEGNALYQSIRKIDYTRYHVSPYGYMLRISPLSQKESAVVSKDAIKKGISFAHIGKIFIDKYHAKNEIKAVKMIFITKKDFPYQELESLLKTNEDITKALDHLLNKVKMDCHSCSLQKICNEVEKKIDTDFKK